MPEGPSIFILREQLSAFAGKKVHEVEGTAKTDIAQIEGKTIKSIRSWGKHLLICFDRFHVDIHLLMFGTVRVNERKELKPRLSMRFSRNQEINFYTCQVRIVDGEPAYDGSADVLSPEWNNARAGRKLKEYPDEMICDLLLDQNIFAGVGNIIKNEVLWYQRLHPENRLGGLSAGKRRAMIREAVRFSYQFLAWKREFVLKKNLKVHGKKVCPRCGLKLVLSYPGKRRRRSFYCGGCQRVYG